MLSYGSDPQDCRKNMPLTAFVKVSVTSAMKYHSDSEPVWTYKDLF